VTALSESLSKEDTIRHSLKDALARAEKVGRELGGKVRELQEKQKNSDTSRTDTIDMELWKRDETPVIKFMVRKPSLYVSH
jgi:hypothetical protein